jgi:hypothetical protein
MVTIAAAVVVLSLCLGPAFPLPAGRVGSQEPALPVPSLQCPASAGLPYTLQTACRDQAACPDVLCMVVVPSSSGPLGGKQDLPRHPSKADFWPASGTFRYHPHKVVTRPHCILVSPQPSMVLRGGVQHGGHASSPPGFRIAHPAVWIPYSLSMATVCQLPSAPRTSPLETQALGHHWPNLILDWSCSGDLLTLPQVCPVH